MGNYNISVSEAFRLYQKNSSTNKTAIFIDVRTSIEYGLCHIDGSTVIDYYSPSFREYLGYLKREIPYIVYCNSGTRSAFAVSLMLEMGFKDVKTMAGGLPEWTNAGYPVISSTNRMQKVYER